MAKLFSILFRAAISLGTHWRIICLILFILKLTLLGLCTCTFSNTEHRNNCLWLLLAQNVYALCLMSSELSRPYDFWASKSSLHTLAGHFITCCWSSCPAQDDVCDCISTKLLHDLMLLIKDHGIHGKALVSGHVYYPFCAKKLTLTTMQGNCLSWKI